tara:strand:- start:526 stop:1218 length:693 start_codon:yes stop_codon:yes gene_type:complete
MRLENKMRNKILKVTKKKLSKRISDIYSFYLKDHGILRALYPNFYQIDENMFRSSQPSPNQIMYLKKSIGIKTIINLRGENNNSVFHMEKEACEQLKLKLINLRTYSKKPPEINQIKNLIELFKTIQYPALIHCKSGSDRTGVVAALYRIIHKKESVNVALNELNWKYGHFKYSNRGILDYFFEQYISENKFSSQSFLMWAESLEYEKFVKTFKPSSSISFVLDKILRRE